MTMAYENGLSMEERVTSLFQPDTLLPDQYFDTYRRKLHLEPEKKLMLAILEDAIACYQKYLFAKDVKGKALFQEAAEWIEQEAGESIFAFESACEGLGLNPEYVRRGADAAAQSAARGGPLTHPFISCGHALGDGCCSPFVLETFYSK